MTFGQVVDVLLATLCVLLAIPLVALVGWLAVAIVHDIRRTRQVEADREHRFQRFMVALAAIRALLTVR